MPGACGVRLRPKAWYWRAPVTAAGTRHTSEPGLDWRTAPDWSIQRSAPAKPESARASCPTAGLRGAPRSIGAFAIQVRGMDEAFSTANLLQWLSPCCYPTDTAEEIMRILSRREGFSATTIMRQQLLAA